MPPIDSADDDLDLSKLDRGDSVGEDTESIGDDTVAPGDDTIAAPPGDDTVVAPPGDDTVAAPPGEDTVAAPPKDDAVPPKKDHMIPKARLEEEVRKRRDLENRLKALEEKIAAPPKVDTPPDPATVPGTEEWFDAREVAYQEAVLDGQTAAATALRKEIRAAELANIDRLASARSREAISTVDVAKEFDTAAGQLETAFTVFDVNSDDYDEDLTQAVLGAQTAIMRREPNKLPGAALLEAAAKLGYKVGAPAADVDDETPPPAAAPARAPARPPAQPPRAGGDAGRDRPAPPRLTEAGVAKMSDVEKARARGDIL